MEQGVGEPTTGIRRVLVIEDDQTLVATLSYNLRKRGHEVTVATDGLEGIRSARATCPDLVILDLMLPNVDGQDVCRYLRTWTDAPILMLTALDREEDVVEGLRIGADDYVTKPFRMNELMARVDALIRRTANASDQKDVLTAGDLTVFVNEHRAVFAGRELHLSPKEFQLLVVLMQRRGKVMSRAELIKEVWGEDIVVDPRNVDVHVRLIRSQLEGEPDGSSLIHTVHGVGYRFTGQHQSRGHPDVR